MKTEPSEFLSVMLENVFIELIWERHWFAVPFTCAFIGWFLDVPWLGIEPAALACWDNALTNWASQPGRCTVKLKYGPSDMLCTVSAHLCARGSWLCLTWMGFLAPGCSTNWTVGWTDREVGGHKKSAASLRASPVHLLGLLSLKSLLRDGRSSPLSLPLGAIP